MKNKIIFFRLLMIIFSFISGCSQTQLSAKKYSKVSSASISSDLYKYIRITVPENQTILELGSIWANSQLGKFYKLYSIEHSKKYLKKKNRNYIYAPVKKNWYDIKVLKKKLPKHYDLILIDGYHGKHFDINGFLKNIKLFKKDVTIIVDFINKPTEFKLMNNLAKLLKRKPLIIRTAQAKSFGVIYPK